MSYIHAGKMPVVMRGDPVDADASDWVFFVYQDWLRDSETIAAHEALIEGGTIVTDSSYIGAMTDETGAEYTDVYAVQFKPDETATQVALTHRVSTTTIDTPDLGRLNMDRTVIIPVKLL